MKQSLIVVQSGELAIEEPESDSMAPTPPSNEADHEWEPSHLDALCVEELSVLPAKLSRVVLAADCRIRRRALRSSRRFTNQSQLSNDNGRLALKRRVLGCGRVLLFELHESVRQAQGTLNPSLSLLRIPPELRLRIYRHLLLTKAYSPIFRGAHDFHLRIPPRSHVYAPSDLWPEILATCKLVHREGTPILYGGNMFEREFSWPAKRLFSSIPWPRSLTSRLSNTSLSYISRVWLAGEYRRWLDDQRTLKVFQEFPGLQYLHLNISFAALSPEERAELESLLADVLKSISRKVEPLKRCECHLRVPWDSHWRAWNRSGAKGFDPHQRCKAYVDRIIRANSLFTCQKVTWRFETLLSREVGPDANVKFAIEYVGSAKESSERPDIQREINFDGEIIHNSVEKDLS